MLRRTAKLNLRRASTSTGSACWLGLALLLLANLASAQTLTVDETEALVRAHYFEGMPREEALRIGPAGARRLIEMLVDPGEHSSHGQIMLALGLSGSPEAMDAIQAWIEIPRVGEVDRHMFRAWQVLPYALGHLARSDRRALAQLDVLMKDGPPNWTFRQHRGPRLGRMTRDAAVTSLAETGMPEAGRILDRVLRDATDVQFEQHLRDARARHRERAREVGR